jgi:hypothetical protein
MHRTVVTNRLIRGRHILLNCFCQDYFCAAFFSPETKAMIFRLQQFEMTLGEYVFYDHVLCFVSNHSFEKSALVVVVKTFQYIATQFKNTKRDAVAMKRRYGLIASPVQLSLSRSPPQPQRQLQSVMQWKLRQDSSVRTLKRGGLSIVGSIVGS